MKDKKPKPDFNPREVAVLLEEVRSEFRHVSEGLDELRITVEGVRVNQAKTLERVTMLEIRLTKVEIRLTTIEKDIADLKRDVAEIKVTFGKRITALEARR